MKACVLRASARVETNPLEFRDVPMPQPARGEVLVRVSMCGVCRTDLHVVEGELPPRKSPVIPGHQIVGVVEKLGEGAHAIPHRRSRGNRLAASAPTARANTAAPEWKTSAIIRTFTGYTVDGGYAEYAVAPEDFIYAIPESFADGGRPRCSAPESSASARCGFPESSAAGAWHFTDLELPRMWPFK